MFPSEEILKLVLAIIVGGLIGAEREFRHRAAGFRIQKRYVKVCIKAN